MAKISVRHGIARAYGFLFGRLFQIIGLSWLPAVFYAVAATFLLERMSGAMQTAVPAENGLLGEYAFAYFIALVAVTAFLGAVISIPLTREALGRHEEAVVVHFVVGAREARLFFALLRFYAIEVVVLVAMVFAAGIAVTSLAEKAASLHIDWVGLSPQTWLNIAAGVMCAAVFLFIATKLGFLIAPVAALEKHAKLGRAAHLARGNFWRLTFVYIAVGLPATLVLLACETSFGGLEMGKTLPKGVQAFYTVDRDHIALFTSILATGLVVLQSLFSGASSAAYEELEDGAVYDRAPAEAGGAYMPALAYAVMRSPVSDMRPGDIRASMSHEQFASQAASNYSVPPAEAVPAIMEAIGQAETHPHQVDAPAAVAPVATVDESAPEMHNTEAAEPAPVPEASTPTVEVAPAVDSAHAETGGEKLIVVDSSVIPAADASASEPAVAAAINGVADGHSEIHAANGDGEASAANGSGAPEEKSASELPPLDPAAMAAAQHTDVAPPT